MLHVLAQAERFLPGYLREGSWHSLNIDYHPPFVERLWTPIQVDGSEYRLYLHKIHPCGPHEALFHPHPWPSAMRVLSGDYEMAVGYGKGSEPPPIAARMVFRLSGLARDQSFRYEMTDPDAWHSVRPIGMPAYSVMVTGAPWGRVSPGPEKELSPLSPSLFRSLLGDFQRYYAA